MLSSTAMTVSLLVSQGLLLAVAAGTLFALHRLKRQVSQQEKRHSAAMRTLQDDFAALCDGAVGVGDHLYHVERYLHRLSERQDQADMNDPSYQSFDYAVRLVKGGAAVEQIMADCGLARSEAELIMMLNRTDKVAS
ncbi:MAG TPA: DUF2802 domain-containing protein [Gammaproteobacteria bacterium]|nr:DUF2802 domain-containing protein [Gammaproteobacteria bacterium]